MIRSSCVQHGPLLPNSSMRSTRLSIRTPRHIARFSSDKQHQTSPTNTAAVTSAGLLESLRADAAFAKQLEDPGFEYIVRSHLLLHDVVTKAVPLHRAPTKVSDPSGAFRKQAPPNPAAPSTPGPLLRVQTLQPAAAAAVPVDWTHRTFALSPFYCYSKSSVFTSDGSLLPHLELEMGVTPGKSEVLLYINMDPRLSPTLVPAYLNHFYLTPPPSHNSAASNTSSSSSNSSSGGGSSSSSSSSSSGGGGGGGGGSSSSSISLPSWSELESRAASCPGLTRFTSPDLHVRVFSSTAILFKMDQSGWSAATEILQDAVGVWTAWATTPTDHGGFVDSPPQSKVDGRDAFTSPAAAMRERSWAWRRFPRRERAAGALRGVFGEQVMEDYWDSMAGDDRIRL